MDLVRIRILARATRALVVVLASGHLYSKCLDWLYIQSVMRSSSFYVPFCYFIQHASG